MDFPSSIYIVEQTACLLLQVICCLWWWWWTICKWFAYESNTICHRRIFSVGAILYKEICICTVVLWYTQLNAAKPDDAYFAVLIKLHTATLNRNRTISSEKCIVNVYQQCHFASSTTRLLASCLATHIFHVLILINNNKTFQTLTNVQYRSKRATKEQIYRFMEF